SRARRHQHRGAVEPSRAQVVERLVGLLERVRRRLRLHAGLRRHAQEGDTVLAGQVRDGQELALFPQQRVRETRDVAHVDAAADDAAALADGLEGRGNERPDRREQDGGIEGLGRGPVGAAGPGGAQRPREGGPWIVSRSYEREYLASLP